MGLFKKIFKGIGKVFKGIGKGIKKGFAKFGKFIDKLGIFGQIGMMFIMPGITNFLMKGLTRLGSGFMAGLAKVGAGKTFAAGVARVSHAVLSTAAKTAGTISKAVGDVTSAVTGTVSETVKSMGNYLTNGKIGTINKVNALGKVVTDPVTKQAMKGGFEDILPNFANRVKGGWTDLTKNVSDISKVVGHSLPGGPAYTPRYETFSKPTEGLLGNRLEGMKKGTFEINYNQKNRELWNEAALRPVSAQVDKEMAKAARLSPSTINTPNDALMSTTPISEVAAADYDPRKLLKMPTMPEAIATVATQKMASLMSPPPEPWELPKGPGAIPLGNPGIDALAAQRGSGVQLPDPVGVGDQFVSPDYTGFATMFDNSPYFDNFRTLGLPQRSVG